MTERLFKLIRENRFYRSADGWTMRRERGTTVNGNAMNGRWVLRDPQGKFIDIDTYRHDLASRHSLVFE